MVKNILFIFLGGGLGSVLRFYLASWLNQQFPLGTLLANLGGCFLIGLILGLFQKEIFSNTHYLALAVGFCGGFTTFSSFAAENLKMLQNEQYLTFFGYVVVSVLAGILFVWLGLSVKKLI